MKSGRFQRVTKLPVKLAPPNSLFWILFNVSIVNVAYQKHLLHFFCNLSFLLSRINMTFGAN